MVQGGTGGNGGDKKRPKYKIQLLVLYVVVFPPSIIKPATTA